MRRLLFWPAALLTVGLALSGCSASGNSRTQTGSTPSSAVSPEPSTDPTKCQTGDFEDREDLVCHYGQTALYPFSTRVDGSREYLPLEITVSAPKKFKPTEPKDNTQKVAVYFDIKVKNLSKKYTAEFSSLFATATAGKDLEDPRSPTGEGVDGDPIYDSDQGIYSVDGLQHLKPGQSYKFKEGFSVESAEGLILELGPNGASSPNYYFIP